MKEGLPFDGKIIQERPWRPSWKQMDALQWTIEHLQSYDQVVFYLEELFEELKEL